MHVLQGAWLLLFVTKIPGPQPFRPSSPWVSPHTRAPRVGGHGLRWETGALNPPAWPTLQGACVIGSVPPWEGDAGLD